MNLQQVDETKGPNEEPEGWRNCHIIRFSQIDGAGIVYYPRYFEMLADSFPQQFAMRQAAEIDLTFRHPVRLGESLRLHKLAEQETGEFAVEGRSGGNLCFELRVAPLQASEHEPWVDNAAAFARKVQIGDWMCGANSCLHLARCYELTAVLMEEWFTESLSCPFATLQSAEGALVPTVRLQTAVHQLPQSGDWVTVSLSVLHIGRSSLTMGMTVKRDGQLLVQTRQTVVFVNYHEEQLGSVEIPQQVLERLRPQLFAETAAVN